LENPDMMAKVVESLFLLCKSGEGDFVLSESNKELPIVKAAEMVINPFSIDYNSRQIQSKLYEELMECESLYLREKAEIQSTIIDYLDKLKQNASYEMITSNIELDTVKLLKLYEVRLEPQCNTVLERLIEYTKVLTRLLRKKLLIITNISSFLNQSDIKELVNMCVYLKMNLLLIESKELDFHGHIKTYIIDNDNCLIIR
jgi:CRISPR-associated protein Csn2